MAQAAAEEAASSRGGSGSEASGCGASAARRTPVQPFQARVNSLRVGVLPDTSGPPLRSSSPVAPSPVSPIPRAVVSRPPPVSSTRRVVGRSPLSHASLSVGSGGDTGVADSRPSRDAPTFSLTLGADQPDPDSVTEADIYKEYKLEGPRFFFIAPSGCLLATSPSIRKTRATRTPLGGLTARWPWNSLVLVTPLPR